LKSSTAASHVEESERNMNLCKAKANAGGDGSLICKMPREQDSHT
jgi:hypothetical protein